MHCVSFKFVDKAKNHLATSKFFVFAHTHTCKLLSCRHLHLFSNAQHVCNIRWADGSMLLTVHHLLPPDTLGMFRRRGSCKGETVDSFSKANIWKRGDLKFIAMERVVALVNKACVP